MTERVFSLPEWLPVGRARCTPFILLPSQPGDHSFICISFSHSFLYLLHFSLVHLIIYSPTYILVLLVSLTRLTNKHRALSLCSPGGLIIKQTNITQNDCFKQQAACVWGGGGVAGSGEAILRTHPSGSGIQEGL